MSGNFLCCIKGVKDPLEVPEVRCDLSGDASAEMGLISPGWENLLDFLELRPVLSTYDRDLRDPPWLPQERSVPMQLLGGLSGFLSCGERLLLRCDGNAGNSFPTTQGKDPFSPARRRKRGSSGCGRDSRASSRVETAMSGKFWICSKGVKDPLEVPEVRCD